ncbi:hypothetical protein [Streptomyces sp. NPDC059009]|uniref:hypothetical protein n=1 Tax=Streptomyces sp. NPDC059009 TaxID=3346694 RepID=UPI0036A13552
MPWPAAVLRLYGSKSPPGASTRRALGLALTASAGVLALVTGCGGASLDSVSSKPPAADGTVPAPAANLTAGTKETDAALAQYRTRFTACLTSKAEAHGLTPDLKRLVRLDRLNGSDSHSRQNTWTELVEAPCRAEVPRPRIQEPTHTGQDRHLAHRRELYRRLSQ